jgi:hypothetical protein
MGRLIALFIISFAHLCEASSANDPRSRFCLVHVINGQPTDADINQTHRLATRVVMLPGIARPVIYALNRGGVWTINEQREFVAFGGKFPANLLHDRYAVDPDTGTIGAVNSLLGLFAARRGESSFTQVETQQDGPSHPYSIAFVSRLGTFVISDANGLFQWNASGAPVALHRSSPDLNNPFRVFDLPDIRALLVSAAGNKVALRYDTGQLENLVELRKYDFVVGAETSDRGDKLVVRSYRRTMVFTRSSGPYRLTSASDETNQIPAPFEAKNRVVSRWNQIRDLGGRKVLHDGQGSFIEHSNGTKTQLQLPFDPAIDGRIWIAELPESRASILFTRHGIFALTDTERFELVATPAQAEHSVLGPVLGITPVRHELLLLGAKSLFLLLDTNIAGSDACARSPI